MARGHEKESQDSDSMSKKTQGQKDFLKSHKNDNLDIGTFKLIDQKLYTSGMWANQKQTDQYQ